MYYIQFDELKVLLTRYTTDVHGSDIPEDAVEVGEHLFCRTIQESDGVWILNQEGNVTKVAKPRPEASEILAQVIAVAREHMNAVARGAGFENIGEAASCAEEPAVPSVQAAGLALRAWRSQVLAGCVGVAEALSKSATTLPSPTEIIAELPHFGASFIDR